ncbi:hypothetical protein PTKIN_Ptkin17bG0075500 [Pterospermum kingtungense]
MASLIKATVWATCFAALIIVIAAQTDMPPGMVMPPGSSMAPAPNTSNHVPPSMAIGLLALIVTIFVVKERA